MTKLFSFLHFQNSNDSYNHTHAQLNIAWQESKVTELRHMLLKNIEPLHSVLDDVINCTTNINDVVTSFTSHLYERAHSIFGKQPHKFKNANFSKNQTNKSWFAKNCQNQKIEFNKIRNAFIKNKTDANKSQFTASRSKYNKIKRQAKLNFKISEGKRLQALAKKEPRKFWKSLKKKYKKTPLCSENLTITDLFDHFKTIYNTEP